LKNVAVVEQHQGNLSMALRHFVEASEIEDTDVVLWHRIGKISEETNKFKLARYAYERALGCSPRHTACMDRLFHVLAILRDDVACLRLACHALHLDPECRIARLHQARLLASAANTHAVSGLSQGCEHSLAALTSKLQEHQSKRVIDYQLRAEQLCLPEYRNVQLFLLQDQTKLFQKHLISQPWLQLGWTLLCDFTQATDGALQPVAQTTRSRTKKRRLSDADDDAIDERNDLLSGIYQPVSLKIIFKDTFTQTSRLNSHIDHEAAIKIPVLDSTTGI
jgi:hypothetical protein